MKASALKILALSRWGRRFRAWKQRFRAKEGQRISARGERGGKKTSHWSRGGPLTVALYEYG
eukprot:97350-Chlamydomonas_euryale.AAC.2